MKTIYAAVFLLFALISQQVLSYQLSFTDNQDGTRVIYNDPKDWYYVDSINNYSVFVEKGLVGSKKREVEYHSLVQFNDPREFSGLPFKIKRIYTFGVMSCEQSKLMILVELYVDENDVVRITQPHDPGTFIVDMSGQSIRGEITKVVCGDTV